MSISTISINRPVLTIVMNLLIMLFGFIGFSYLGVREYPSIDPPVITVRTNYTGANADIIESRITEPLEKSINGIAGIKSISSSSNNGSSIITVEFDISADLESAANDVRDKVSQAVRNLPPDLDGMPTVTKSDANSDAIISMTLQSDTRSHLEVSDYAENVIAERLQTIEGVSAIQIWGQKRYAMRIWINPVKLNAAGLTPQDIKTALDKNNIEIPAGKVSGNETELTIRTTDKLRNEEEFNNLPLRTVNGKTIRLKDIGYARLGTENEETVLKESGIPMIGLALVPQPGANYIDIADEFYRRYDQLKDELPKDYKINIALDNTQFIRKSISEVQETLLIAIILVIIIIYLFFRDWVIAFRPLIDIPVSLVGAFFIMYIMGYSINVLSLLAIVLATGLVVDDGIVVTENIYKKVEEGMSPREAAIKGSNEIFFAVISTSITLAAVFLPVIFMEGFVGRLFQEFGVVLAGSVLISAFVSLTLTPMLNAKLVRKNHKKSKFYERTEHLFVKMNESYRNGLNRYLKYRWTAILIIVSCLVVGVYFWIFMLKSELAPLEDRNWFRMQVSAPEGASFEYTDRFMDKITRFIEDSIPEKKVCLTVTAPNFAGSGSVNSGFVRLVLVPSEERKRTQQQIADYIMMNAGNFPEGKIFVIQQQTISQDSRGGQPIQFVIQAPNFEALKDKLPKFLEEASKHPSLMGVDVNLKFNKPELNIKSFRDKATDLGISAIDVATALQLSYSSQRLSYFNVDGKQYQVIGQVEREYRDEPGDIFSMYVRNDKGQLIQLDNILEYTNESSPPQLYHYNRYMSATVSASLAPGKTIGDGIAAMEEVREKVLDDSFHTALTGSSRDYAESSSSLLFAFLLALLLVYLILAAQFESFADPLIVIFTVPLALAGAVIFLWYFNQTRNIFSEIGMIMLVGLVTKNGILIVEFANQLQEKGMQKAEAIKAAAVARLRPILMTSMATALGALPIAASLGAAAQSRMGMGIVIVCGLLFSLGLTLFVIPAMYSYLGKNYHKKTAHEKD